MSKVGLGDAPSKTLVSITLPVSGVLIEVDPPGVGGGKTEISRVEGVGDR